MSFNSIYNDRISYIHFKHLHSAKAPPEPIPITPESISTTLPLPSNSTIKFLSHTKIEASRCLNYLPKKII